MFHFAFANFDYMMLLGPTTVYFVPGGFARKIIFWSHWEFLGKKAHGFVGQRQLRNFHWGLH